MTATALLIAAALLGQARAGVVELSCSDNATCIENLANEFVRSVRQQKTVRLFDVLTVEPLGTRQARSNEGLLARILNHNAFSFDWNDYTFRIQKAQNRNDALDFEVFESRTAKDVSEENPKKSKSKVEEEEQVEENKKSPKGAIRRRRAKKKIMQAVIPMLFGMKSAAVVIFAMAVVTVLTMKAFVASKMALLVTVGMAVKRLYESYSLGVGLQNHPYLYSQYPIDFPSASSHAYSVSGMSPQFPEMYNPTALGTHQQSELLPHNDASAQQSQQAPTVQLLNSTRASERWDGKSKLQKLLEPIVEGIKSYLDPIANVFYSMPATFRGLNSDVTTTKTVETEEVKKPKEILVPQPRNIAQRKMNYRKTGFRTRPKKYAELKLDLDKLKKNKDLYDYMRTKKYKHNYQHTYFYPRVKYFVNPNTFIVKPKNNNNNRLVPYKKDIYNATVSTKVNNTGLPLNVWKPIVLVPAVSVNSSKVNVTEAFPKKIKNVQVKYIKRSKRSIQLDGNTNTPINNTNSVGKIDLTNELALAGRGFMQFINSIMDSDPISGMVKYATKYTKSAIKHSFKTAGPPQYYQVTYEILMMTLDVIDGLVQVHEAITDYFIEGKEFKKKIHSNSHSHHHGNKKKKQKQKKKKQKKPHGHHQNVNQVQEDEEEEWLLAKQ